MQLCQRNLLPTNRKCIPSEDESLSLITAGWNRPSALPVSLSCYDLASCKSDKPANCSAA